MGEAYVDLEPAEMTSASIGLTVLP
jgi:hypothetical protein